MGKRKIIIRKSVAENIAAIAWFIESKGMVKTAEKFSDAVYDFIETLADDRIIHHICREPERNMLGLKCVPFKKKYTIIFFESNDEIIIHEFVNSKIIRW